MDKLSYALGLSMGHNFIGSGIKELKYADFAEGVKAVYEGEEKKMTFDEAKQIINEYFTNLEKEAAEANVKAGEQFLAENAKRPEVTVTASGLQYEVLTEGTGAKPAKSDRVTVHYTGKLLDGRVFDSSVERGEPATFGVTQVIGGWVEALQLMSEGAKWRLFIPSHLAPSRCGWHDWP